MNPRLSRRKSYAVQEIDVYPKLGAALFAYLSAVEENFPGLLMQLACARTAQGIATVDDFTINCPYSLHERLFFTGFTVTAPEKTPITLDNRPLQLAISEYPGLLYDLSHLVNNVELTYSILNLTRITTNRDKFTDRVLPENWMDLLKIALEKNEASTFNALTPRQKLRMQDLIRQTIAATLYQWLLSNPNITNVNTNELTSFIKTVANAIGYTPESIIDEKKSDFKHMLSKSLLPTTFLLDQLIENDKKKIKQSLLSIQAGLNSLILNRHFIQLKIYSPAIVVAHLHNIITLIHAMDPAPKQAHASIRKIFKYCIDFIKAHHHVLITTKHGLDAVIALLKDVNVPANKTKPQQLLATFENKAIERAAKAEENALKEARYRRLEAVLVHTKRDSLHGDEAPKLRRSYSTNDMQLTPTLESTLDDSSPSTAAIASEGAALEAPTKIKRGKSRVRLTHFFHAAGSLKRAKSVGEQSPSDKRKDEDEETVQQRELEKAASKETSPPPLRKAKVRKFSINQEDAPTESELAELGVFATVKKPDSPIIARQPGSKNKR